MTATLFACQRGTGAHPPILHNPAAEHEIVIRYAPASNHIAIGCTCQRHWLACQPSYAPGEAITVWRAHMADVTRAGTG